MGIFDKGMAKFIACCALLLAVALAAQKDTIQDLGAVQMIQDDSSMGADVVYRLSFRTQFDSDPAKTASKGTFTIKITGTAGNTGDLTLVSHPGYECNAKSDAECFPALTAPSWLTLMATVCVRVILPPPATTKTM